MWLLFIPSLLTVFLSISLSLLRLQSELWPESTHQEQSSHNLLIFITLDPYQEIQRQFEKSNERKQTETKTVFEKISTFEFRRKKKMALNFFEFVDTGSIG